MQKSPLTAIFAFCGRSNSAGHCYARDSKDFSPCSAEQGEKSGDRGQAEFFATAKNERLTESLYFRFSPE